MAMGDPRGTIAASPRLRGERILLPIPETDWTPPSSPASLREGIALAPKSELHITLVGSHLGAGLRRNLGDAFLVEALRALVPQFDWRFGRGGRRLLLRKRDHGGDGGQPRLRHSLVELVSLPAMAPLHHALGRLLGRQLPVPPPHVTLYVAGDPRGIGVPTRSMLRACTVREVAAAELARR
jgi:hypothetical protein